MGSYFAEALAASECQWPPRREEGAGWLVRYHGVMSRLMDGVKIDRSRRGGKGDNDKERESTLTKTRAINCAKRLTDGLTD